MSAYFRKIETQILPTWSATTSAGSFLAMVVKSPSGEWVVETGKATEAVTHFRTPSLEAAFDFVTEQLSGLVKVK